jgi:uncharacterized protein VirK/YbjX
MVVVVAVAISPTNWKDERRVWADYQKIWLEMSGGRGMNLYSARICKRVRERKIPTRETEERRERKREDRGRREEGRCAQSAL